MCCSYFSQSPLVPTCQKFSSTSPGFSSTTWPEMFPWASLKCILHSFTHTCDVWGVSLRLLLISVELDWSVDRADVRCDHWMVCVEYWINPFLTPRSIETCKCRNTLSKSVFSEYDLICHYTHTYLWRCSSHFLCVNYLLFILGEFNVKNRSKMLYFL